MIRILLTLVCVLVAFGSEALESEKETNKGDYVVLLHGFGRTHRSMSRLQKRIEEDGFRVVSIDYASFKRPIKELGADVKKEIDARCTDKDVKIHFVTHSMGGIVLRQFLKDNALPNLGRVVMLSPPNGGTEVVDRLKGSWFSRLAGAGARDLATDQAAAPRRLGPVDFELGVIASTRSINPLFSWIIPGKDDGMVAIERMKVEGMRDFFTVRVSHSMVMYNREVARQVKEFLKNGKFKRE